MDELISRKAVLNKSMNVGLCDAYGGYYGNGEVVLIDDIKSAPTVDAVEVVRCKDCEYFKLFSDGYIKCKHKYGLAQIDSDSFCCRGERKTNATDRR